MELKNWLQSQRGRGKELADFLGISQGRVSQIAVEGVPAKYMLRVRDFTQGEVSLESMLHAKQQMAITVITA